MSFFALCCCGSEDPASAKPLLSRRLIGFGGAPALQSISSRQVEKYRVGHVVQGLGPQRLTGTVVRIEAAAASTTRMARAWASAPGQPPQGPGTLFVKTDDDGDDGGDDVTSVVPLAAGSGGRRDILVGSRPMGIALHADPAGPTPTKLFKPAAPFPGLPVGSVLIEIDGKCVAMWHYDRVLEAIKGAQLPITLTFDTVLPPPEPMAMNSVGGAATTTEHTTVQATAAEEQQLKAKIAAQLAAASATPYPAAGGAAAADPAGPAAPPVPPAEAKAAATGPVIFTLRQLESATNGFAAANKIAEGAFGVVFKGVLETGSTIAVKVLKREALDAAQAAIKQGREDQAQYMGTAGFLKELSVLGKYRHMNIVALLGFLNLTPGEGSAAKWKGTFSSPPKQCLVLEFMPGGSLKRRLAPDSSERPLTAQERFLVASDIARGLEYLHVEADPTLLHQDVKTDNILLACYDHRICAKVSDFGTARYYKPQQQQNFHQTVNVVGTSAYMAPEYHMGHVSEKTDSFAFGVVLLELLTGKPAAIYGKGQMLWAEMASAIDGDEHELRKLFDRRLGGSGQWPLSEALALARIARRCIYVDVGKRCEVREVRVELDVLAGRVAAPRAPKGKHFDPYTGKLVDD